MDCCDAAEDTKTITCDKQVQIYQSSVSGWQSGRGRFAALSGEIVDAGNALRNFGKDTQRPSGFSLNRMN
jgi:hypothetical protein